MTGRQAAGQQMSLKCTDDALAAPFLWLSGVMQQSVAALKKLIKKRAVDFFFRKSYRA